MYKWRRGISGKHITFALYSLVAIQNQLNSQQNTEQNHYCLSRSSILNQLMSQDRITFRNCCFVSWKYWKSNPMLSAKLESTIHTCNVLLIDPNLPIPSSDDAHAAIWHPVRDTSICLWHSQCITTKIPLFLSRLFSLNQVGL